MLEIADADIGGARVRRTFTSNGRQMKRGDQLSTEEVLGFNLPNRRALIDSNFIEVYPKAPNLGKKYMVALGKDKYNVIQGHILNEHPLTRDQAERLADS